MSKNGKRILSVKLFHKVDESPDTSYLGEYSSNKTSQFSIDRKHAHDCLINDALAPRTLEMVEHAIEYLESVMVICYDHLDVSEADCEKCTDEMPMQRAMNDLRDLLDDECTCDGSGDMGRHEYLYFNPSFNYVTKDDKPADKLTADDVRKYVRQDYERMERLNRGDWCYIGITTEAEIGIPRGTDSYLCQTLTSGGIWGIESDAGRAHIEEEERGQLSELRDVLKQFGFSTRAISKAFKNVEIKNG